MLRVFLEPPIASPRLAWWITAALIVVIGVSDYFSGTDASLAIFYLVPVVLITSWRGPRSGVGAALTCTITRIVSDGLLVYPTRPTISLYWNALASFVIAVLIVWLLDALLSVHRDLELKILQRTAELRHAVNERARLERELLDVSSRERSAFGRELHDEIGQHLVATALAVQALAQRLTGPLATEALAVVDWAEQAVAKTRNLARGLLLAEIKPERLVEELEGLSNVAVQSGAAFEVVQAGPRVSANALECAQLFRIAQEAVTNAARHANAKRITLSLENAAGTISLAIDDDGIGLPEQRNGSGVGLQIMRQRARLIGGDFSAQKRNPQGTRIVCVLPPNRALPHG